MSFNSRFSSRLLVLYLSWVLVGIAMFSLVQFSSRFSSVASSSPTRRLWDCSGAESPADASVRTLYVFEVAARRDMFCRRGISIMQKYGRLVVGVGMFMIDEWCHVIDSSFFAVSSRTHSIRGPKRNSPSFCDNFIHHIFTSYQYSFTGILCSKFSVKFNHWRSRHTLNASAVHHLVKYQCQLWI